MSARPIEIKIQYTAPIPQNITAFAVAYADAKRTAKIANKSYWSSLWVQSVRLNEFDIDNRYKGFLIKEQPVPSLKEQD